MIVRHIWLLDSSYGGLGSVEFPFIAITPTQTRNGGDS